MAPTVDKNSGAWAFSAATRTWGWWSEAYLYLLGCKVDKSISRYSWPILDNCGTSVILEWFFVGLEIDITMFNPPKRIHDLFWNFEIVVNFERHDSLHTHIYSLGRPISYNWETKTLCKEPKSAHCFNLFFPACRMWWLLVWNFMVLGGFM